MRLTVLMAVYNAAPFVKASVKSILDQTYSDFEFLIINDGCTDETMDRIREFQDSRIRIVENDNNIGLTKSLNRGLALAKGEYVARQDADDLSPLIKSQGVEQIS